MHILRTIHEQSPPPQPQNVFITFSFGKDAEDGFLDDSNSDLPFQTETGPNGCISDIYSELP